MFYFDFDSDYYSLSVYLLNSINTQIQLKTNEQNPSIKKVISA